MQRKYILIFFKLHEKKFRVMTVKMIQNYIKKRVQTKTEKIQEMFNKNIEGLRKTCGDEWNNN